MQKNVSLQEFLNIWQNCTKNGHHNSRIVKYKAKRDDFPSGDGFFCPFNPKYFTGVLTFTQWSTFHIFTTSIEYEFDNVNGHGPVEEEILDIFRLENIPLVEGEWTMEGIDKTQKIRKSICNKKEYVIT